MKLDCDTRWNSVLHMLERAYLLRHPIEEALSTLKYLKDHQPKICLNWTRIKTLIDFLEPCHELTRDASGQKYVSISTVTTHAPVLAEHASKFDVDPALGEAAKSLAVKLNEYDDYLTNDLTVLATMLDPRIKATFLIGPDKTRFEKLLCELAHKLEPEEPASNELFESQSAIDMSLSRSIYKHIYRDPAIKISDDYIKNYL